MCDLVSMEAVEFDYGSRRDCFRLKVAQLNIRPGEFLGIVGRSGSGKTTLLNLALGELHPTKGSVRRSPSLSVGYVGQTDSLVPWLTVRGNIARASHASDRPKQKSKSPSQLDDVISALGLDRDQHKFPDALSGGMRRRVMLGRAIVRSVDLIVLDEPMTGLDVFARDELLELMQHVFVKYRFGALFVTHDVDDIVQIATRILIVGDTGDVSEMEYARPPQARPRRFDEATNVTARRIYDALNQRGEE